MDEAPPENNDGEATSFDFVQHRIRAERQYQRQLSLFADFASCVKSILQDCLRVRNIQIASLEARAKAVDHFGAKAALPRESDSNQPRYPNPMEDITDLAGIRVLTFFPNTVTQISEAIEDEFKVRERTDKSELLWQEERFGYQSIHLLVQLSNARVALAEYARYKAMVAEIQVRTILQHAWAEIEHDIQYKSSVAMPSAIRRRFMSLAGLLEIADREFQAIQTEDERARQEARDSVAKGQLSGLELTPDALKAYLDRRLQPDGRISSWAYEFEVRVLKSLGFSSVEQVEGCVGQYDAESLSRLVFPGYLQGQITRFDLMLLAGLGESYAARHPLQRFEWFQQPTRERLEKIRAANVPVGTFQPPGDEVESTGK